MKENRKRILIKFILALFVGLLILFAFAFRLYKGKALDIKKASYVYISDQDNSESLSKLLQEQVGLKYPYVFKKLAKRMNLDRWMKNGRYTVEENMTLIDVIKVFRAGKMKSVDFVLKPLSGLEKFAQRCAQKLEPDSPDFIGVFEDSLFLASLGFNKLNIYAMLMPDTYNLLWHTNPQELLRYLKLEYDKYWDSSKRAKADSCGLDLISVSILASIVAKETNKADEMPLVAGLYLNRLRIQMKLQADPTIKFALNEPGIRRIYKGHLDINSPYNTYLHVGLPPGPICIPPKQAIEAVLNYAKHDYLFMCAKEDFSGYHYFARTYREHLKFADLYKKALDKRGIK